MSWKYKPFLFIIPEDRANQQIANGFVQYFAVKPNHVAVEDPAGGRDYVIEGLKTSYAARLQENPKLSVVLLLDSDQCEDRIKFVDEKLEESLTENLRERVFVLGARPNPEELKKNLKMTFEEIGEALADDCHKNKDVSCWSSAGLTHNAAELERLKKQVQPFLFTT